jgi:sulfate adenylyltransferase subunit 1
MEIARVFTAGSVNDGKSTLIGRLLLDSNAISTDIMQQLTALNASDVLDLALLSDGLRAERDLGITIDVAYKYFTTKRKKFILLDTPGHKEYTRNMFTGASNCQMAILLVDVTQGITSQTLKHIEIVAILGIPYVIFAINKMDKVDFQEAGFIRCQQDLCSALQSFPDLPKVDFIPVCALDGDNIVHPSVKMDWYKGGALLEAIEAVEIPLDFSPENLVLEIQGLMENYFFANVVSGTYDPQHPLFHKEIALPRLQSLNVHGISLQTMKQGEQVGFSMDGMPVLQKGDRIYADSCPIIARDFVAVVCWMSEGINESKNTFGLISGSFETTVHVDWKQTQIEINDMVEVDLHLEKERCCFEHTLAKKRERFILYDLDTFSTVAAGMIKNELK